jgi:hypothetical protein
MIYLGYVYTLAKVKITTSNRKEIYPLKRKNYDKLYVTYPIFSSNIGVLNGVILP